MMIVLVCRISVNVRSYAPSSRGETGVAREKDD